MVKSQRKNFPGNFRAFFLSAVLLLVCFFGQGQTYAPGLHVVTNDAISPAQATPVDARSMFYDGNNFVYRDYNGTTEVLTYLNLGKYRFGHFPIYVHNGGSLSAGVWTGGTTQVFFFKNGTADSNLVRWYTDSTGGSCSGCLLAANNLSELTNANTARANLGLGAMAVLGTTAGGDLSGTFPNPTVSRFNGQLPSFYLNYTNLTNKPVGLSLTTTGTSGVSTYNPTTGVLNIPNYATGGGGGSCLNCNADSIRTLPVVMDSVRNGYVLTLDTVLGRWVPRLPGSGTSGISALTGDVSASGVGSVAATVNGIKGVSIPTLATGVLTYNSGTGLFSWSASSGAVASVSNSDGTLLITPTTGSVVASLSLSHANTWITNPQTFNGGLALGNNVTFATDNTYQIGTSSVGASHVWSRIFNSDASASLSAATGNSASLAIGASSGITLLSTGQAQLNNYTTSSSFTGTPLAFLQTDASGNVIQAPLSSVQGALTLTTTGTSGAATLTGTTLNIPQYTGGGGGGSGAKPLAGNGLVYYPDTSHLAVDSPVRKVGVILSPIIENNVQEPCLFTDNQTHLLGKSSTDSAFKGIVTDGWIAGHIDYVEYDTATGMVRYSTPLLTGYAHASAHLKGDSIIIYAMKISTVSIDRFAFSRLSATPTAVLTNSNVIVPSGVANTWNKNGVFNTSAPVQCPDSSNAWYMSVDGNGPYIYTDAIFKSTDDVNWTQISSNASLLGAATFLTGGDLHYDGINHKWYFVGHRVELSIQPLNSLFTPTDGYYQWGKTLATLVQSVRQPILKRTQEDEGPRSAVGQIADLCAVEFKNKTYIFYDATRDGVSPGPNPTYLWPGLQIKLAVIQSPLLNWFNANSRGIAPVETRWNDDDSIGNAVRSQLWTNSAVGIGQPATFNAMLSLGAGSPATSGIIQNVINHFPITNPQLYLGYMHLDSFGVHYTMRIGNNTGQAFHTLADSNTVWPAIKAITLKSLLDDPIVANRTVVRDTIYGDIVHNSDVYAGNFFLSQGFGASPVFNAGTIGAFVAGGSNTLPQVHIGSLYMGSQSVNSGYWGTYYLSGSNIVGNGTAGMIARQVGGSFYIQNAATSTLGANTTVNTPFVAFVSGNSGFNESADQGTAQVQITNASSQPHLDLYLGSSHALFQTSSGIFTLNSTGISELHFSGAMVPYATGGTFDSVYVSLTPSGQTYNRMMRVPKSLFVVDSSVYYTTYRSDTSRANIYAAIAASGGGGGGVIQPSGQIVYGTGTSVTSNANFTYVSPQLQVAGTGASGSLFRAGSLEASFAATQGNMFIGDNIYYTSASGFLYRNTAAGSGMYLLSGDGALASAVSGTSGTAAALTYPIAWNRGDSVGLGNNISSFSTLSNARFIVGNTAGYVRIPNAVSATATATTPADTTLYKLAVLDANGFIRKLPSWGTLFSGGGSPTLTYTQNATNNNLSVTGGSNVNFLTATASLAGLLDTGRAKSIDSIRNGIKTFTLFFANGLTAAGGDSAYFGGTLNHSTTLALGGFPMKFIGLPPSVTATNTTALVRNATDSSLAQLALSSGSYTPTFTNTTNIAASSSAVGIYSRTGNVVHVTISGILAPTAGSSGFILTVSLPISSTTTPIGSGNGAWWSNGSGTPTAQLQPGLVTMASSSTVVFSVYNNTVNNSSEPFSFSFDYILN